MARTYGESTTKQKCDVSISILSLYSSSSIVYLFSSVTLTRFEGKKKKSEREKKKKIKNFSSFFFLFPPPSLPILFLDDLSSILISVSSFGLSPPPFRPSTLRFITFSCFNLFTVIYRTFFFYHRNVKRWTAAFSVEHGGLTIHRHGSATTTQHFLR